LAFRLQNAAPPIVGRAAFFDFAVSDCRLFVTRNIAEKFCFVPTRNPRIGGENASFFEKSQKKGGKTGKNRASALSASL